jgi:2-polyprenyl-3-methyl-5-hydroxy-6-metoxy-1,4-benzoquinol methylase
MSAAREERLRNSWEVNAQAWTSVVRENRIASRNAGTNEAVLSILASMTKGRLLDVGCGEGWLSRAATEQGWRVVGVDASAPLIDRAREHVQAEYLVIDYDQLGDQLSRRSPFDCIVCNFAILSEDIQPLLTTLRTLLSPKGSLILQTVHPWIACGDQPYVEGWREESFQGWEGEFKVSMPWFFRTLESWFSELSRAGWVVSTLREPVDPVSGKPLSLLLVLKPLTQSE